jgi:hypothetical protein
MRACTRRAADCLVGDRLRGSPCEVTGKVPACLRVLSWTFLPAAHLFPFGEQTTVVICAWTSEQAGVRLTEVRLTCITNQHSIAEQSITLHWM